MRWDARGEFAAFGQRLPYDADGNLEVSYVVGDMNCDGLLNNGDISAFVLALSDPATYATTYPDCDVLNGDVTGDGTLNNDDIQPFLALISTWPLSTGIYARYDWAAENRLIRVRPGGAAVAGDQRIEFSVFRCQFSVGSAGGTLDSQAGSLCHTKHGGRAGSEENLRPAVHWRARRRGSSHYRDSRRGSSHYRGLRRGSSHYRSYCGLRRSRHRPRAASGTMPKTPRPQALTWSPPVPGWS